MALRPLALAALLAATALPAHAQPGPFPRFKDGVAEVPAVATRNAPFDVTRFFAAPPRDQNAAPHYLAALAEFGPEAAACCDPRDVPEFDARVLRARTRSAWFAAAFARRTEDPKLLPVAELDRLVAEYAEGFRLLREAQRRERCVFQTGAGIDAFLPHVQAAQLVARVAAFKARRELDRGEIDAAIADVAITLRLARDLRPRGVLITQLVASSIIQTAADELITPILAAPGLAPSHCANLLATLKAHESQPFDPLAEGLKAQYVASRVTLDDLVNHQDRLARQIQPGPDASVVRSFVAWVTHPFLGGCDPDVDLPPPPDDVDALIRAAAPGDVDRAVDGLNAQFRPLLDLAGLPRADQLREAPKGRDVVPGRDLLIRLLLVFQPDVSYVIPRLARSEASLRAQLALIALRRWQLTHEGASPTPAEFLAACRAAGLPGVPLDPFDGQPLRYVLDKGRPTLISSGKDASGNPHTFRLPPPPPAAP